MRRSRLSVKSRQVGPGRLGKLRAATAAVRTSAYRQARGLPASRYRASYGNKPRYGEIKGVDTDVSLTPVIATTNTNASSFVLNLVQQGNGSWNRVGRKIYPRSLRLKGNVSILVSPTVATGVSLDNFVRCVVVWDQQPPGAAGTIPTFDTIFGITAQDGTESTPDITNPPRYDGMERFRVLFDRTYGLPQAFVSSMGTGPGHTHFIPMDEYIKLPSGLETTFLGQSNPMTIADVATGAIYVFFRALQNTANTGCAIDGIVRFRYTD